VRDLSKKERSKRIEIAAEWRWLRGKGAVYAQVSEAFIREHICKPLRRGETVFLSRKGIQGGDKEALGLDLVISCIGIISLFYKQSSKTKIRNPEDLIAALSRSKSLKQAATSLGTNSHRLLELCRREGIVWREHCIDGRTGRDERKSNTA